MKKWIYLVIPAVLLGLFLVFYFAHQKEAVVREQTRATALAQKQAELKKQKDLAENKAKQQAIETQRQREEEDRKKEKDRRDKQMAADKQISDETNGYLAEGKKSQQESAALEIERDRLYKEKDRVGREAFDLAKQAELAKVARRNAELEEQRMIEMIARKATDSAMAKMPPPPPPPAPPAK